MTGPEPGVSAIVVAWRSPAALRGCLAALSIQGVRLQETLIVLNGATSEVRQAALEHPDAILVDSVANLGFGAGCDVAAARASYPYLWLVNDDAAPSAGCLDLLCAVVDAEPDVAAVGGTLIGLDGIVQEAGCALLADGIHQELHRGEPGPPLHLPPFDVDYCSAASMLVRAGDFAAVGGFDDRYAPAYFEDVHLALALRGRGRRIRCQPAAVTVHIGASSTSAGWRRFLYERNRLLLTQAWGLPPLPTLAAPASPADPIDVLARIQEAQLTYLGMLEEHVEHLTGSEAWLSSEVGRIELLRAAAEERVVELAAQSAADAERIHHDHLWAVEASARLQQLQQHIDGLTTRPVTTGLRRTLELIARLTARLPRRSGDTSPRQ